MNIHKLKMLYLRSVTVYCTALGVNRNEKVKAFKIDKRTDIDLHRD